LVAAALGPVALWGGAGGAVTLLDRFVIAILNGGAAAFAGAIVGLVGYAAPCSQYLPAVAIWSGVLFFAVSLVLNDGDSVDTVGSLFSSLWFVLCVFLAAAGFHSFDPSRTEDLRSDQSVRQALFIQLFWGIGVAIIFAINWNSHC
jgi:hypothetical protein